MIPKLADWCAIDIVDADGRLIPLIVAHPDPQQVKHTQELRRPYPLNPDALYGLLNVLRTGTSELYSEISEAMLVTVTHDTEYLKLLQELGLNSVMIVAIPGRGQILGVMTLALESSNRRRYNLTDLSLAEELARQAGFAIDNARLYREAQEANRIKDEFLAILSHELRTPLNAMLGWAQLLRTQKLNEGMTSRALETIERNAKAQSQMIEDLLDLSRIMTGKIELKAQPVELFTIVSQAIDAVRLVAETKQIEMRVIPSHSAVVWGDSNRLQQVLCNLLSNAVKFTPQGGRVEVELLVAMPHKEEKKAVDVAPACSLPSAQIRVSDTGIGIHPDFLPFVFDRFRQADSTSTRSYGGLGLGLAIVRHLVELHGGSIWAESQGEGQGASFTIQLPLLYPENAKEWGVGQGTLVMEHGG